MTINELQFKGVFKDPLFLYDQFKKAYNKFYNNEEFDIKENIFANSLLFEGKGIFVKEFPEEVCELVLKKINNFFKKFSKLLIYVETYCESNNLEWDIYPSFLNQYNNFILSFNLIIKLKDFDLIGGRNNKVWSYKDPYISFSVEFKNHGLFIPYSCLSLFFGKTHLLGFVNNFNHPHITNRLVKEMFEEGNTDSFAQKLREKNCEGSFCFGNSRLQDDIDNMINDQEEFNYFMFRLTNYIKEYNSPDCFKKVPTGIKIPHRESIIRLNKSDISGHLILTSGFNLKPEYFFIANGQLEILDYFYKDFVSYYLNNREKVNNPINKFMLDNLTNGELTLTELLGLSTEDNIYETMLEDNKSKSPSFLFNGKEVKLELYYEKHEVNFEYQDLYLTEDAKYFLKELIIKYINENYEQRN